jgi:hypothetical protein
VLRIFTKAIRKYIRKSRFLTNKIYLKVMKKTITLLFLILGTFTISNAQEHFELEASTG